VCALQYDMFVVGPACGAGCGNLHRPRETHTRVGPSVVSARAPSTVVTRVVQIRLSDSLQLLQL